MLETKTVTNGPSAKQIQQAWHDTLPWLISFSLGVTLHVRQNQTTNTKQNTHMKTMTCKELGGACDLEFHGNTFEEIAQMSQKHGKEMFQKGDKAHLQAMSKMRDLMQSEDGMAKWMESKRKEFEAKPNKK
jgi:hypothetical protein